MPDHNDHEQVEADTQELMADFDGMDDIDLEAVDITVPEVYAVRMWAHRRSQLVRDANLFQREMLAHKVLNPPKAKEADDAYRTCLLQIGWIDKVHRDSKRLSKEIMELQALEEADNDRERRKVVAERQRHREAEEHPVPVPLRR